MIKNERILGAYKIISFNVSSLFTIVLLEYAINLAFKRSYIDKEIETKISRKHMKNLLLLCTKKVYFTFQSNI